MNNEEALWCTAQRDFDQVEFVIIGGICGIMHGVSLVTTDLEVCCRFTSENLYRIQATVRPP